MYALIIVDMIHDFVYGKFGNKRAQSIIDNIRKIKDLAKSKNWKIVYLQDFHIPENSELKVWGEHAMGGTKGADIVPELIFDASDTVIKKSTYDGFFNTDLDSILKKEKISYLIFTGVSTDICVLNTVASAFFRGYDIFVVKEGTESITEKNKEFGLEYMKRIYGAKIVSIEELGGL